MAFVVWGGRPMLEWSLDVLRATCDRVVVAVPPDGDLSGPDEVHGGATRSESVRPALDAAPEATVVVVHDAARPLVTPELVGACIEGLQGGYSAAIAAAAMTDTVKETDPDGHVVRTLDRKVLWRIQTPQVFRADVLRRALDVDDATLAAATDDATLIEAAGGSVRVVEAPADNIKVTRPVDLKLAEMLLSERD